MVFLAFGSLPRGQSQPDVDSHVEGHTNISAADVPSTAASSILQKHACVVRRPRMSSGAALFRWRTHANEGMCTVGRVKPGLGDSEAAPLHFGPKTHLLNLKHYGPLPLGVCVYALGSTRPAQGPFLESTASGAFLNDPAKAARSLQEHARKASERAAPTSPR
jgi:hypothetical protein